VDPYFANFIDKSFDVLNPEYSIDKLSSIISIVQFIFKNVSLSNYLVCHHFNICHFQVRYVQIPKHSFMLNLCFPFPVLFDFEKLKFIVANSSCSLFFCHGYDSTI
jgi:hypothetical protein